LGQCRSNNPPGILDLQWWHQGYGEEVLQPFRPDLQRQTDTFSGWAQTSQGHQHELYSPVIGTSLLVGKHLAIATKTLRTKTPYHLRSIQPVRQTMFS
jgi:hypothetical protein